MKSSIQVIFTLGEFNYKWLIGSETDLKSNVPLLLSGFFGTKGVPLYNPLLIGGNKDPLASKFSRSCKDGILSFNSPNYKLLFVFVFFISI